MSRPTPTAEEQARHARGERLSVHEYDGSPLQPGAHAPGDPAREAKPEEPVSAVELTQAKAEPTVPDVDEPPKAEEKAASAEPHRARYSTRRMKAAEDEDKKED